VDVLTPEQRSRCMAAIKAKNTKPEIAVRSMLDTLKVKYELHRSDLPGKPDIVLPRHKKIIFVHGCFWHVHSCRYGRVKPASNASFWSDKRGKTKLRDVKNRKALRKEGWALLTVWECWTKKPKKLTDKLDKFLTDFP
jgi:DNA mismatch endonuclease (patch repair protein)